MKKKEKVKIKRSNRKINKEKKKLPFLPIMLISHTTYNHWFSKK